MVADEGCSSGNVDIVRLLRRAPLDKGRWEVESFCVTLHLEKGVDDLKSRYG